VWTPNRIWLALVLVGILGVGFLAGCSGSGEAAKPAVSAAGETTATAPAAPAPKTTTSQELDYAALLTPADVEGVSGLSGLKTVPYDPKTGAGGKVNIAEADGQLVAMLLVHGPEYYKIWKGDGRTFLRVYTPTVGDESFIGPVKSVSSQPYIFGFKKGSRAVVIDTYLRDKGATTILSVSQLAKLAEIVASRL